MGGRLLFTSDEFHDLNDVPRDQRFRYEHRASDRLVGVLDGVVSGGDFVSGHSAPFGGVDLVREDPTVDSLTGLVAGAVSDLVDRGIDSATVRARPAVYSPAEPLVEFVLLDSGFEVSEWVINMHIDLTPIHQGADPLHVLVGRKRSYVRACQREPFELEEVTGPDDIADACSVLDANRDDHGRRRGLTAEYLVRARRAFGDRIRVHALRHDGVRVAAAVIFRVLEDVDLMINWGDAGHSLTRSPMDLLAYNMIAESARTGARILDLGPSSHPEGGANLGLVAFKRSVGAVPSARKTYRRMLPRG